MRFISFLLSIYILALAVSPCEDKDSCSKGSKDAIACLQSENSHDNQCQSETCNPLCICSCCGGITLVSENIIKIIPFTSSAHQSIYMQTEVPEISFSIWQPPKIG